MMYWLSEDRLDRMWKIIDILEHEEEPTIEQPEEGEAEGLLERMKRLNEQRRKAKTDHH